MQRNQNMLWKNNTEYNQHTERGEGRKEPIIRGMQTQKKHEDWDGHFHA